MSLKKIEQIRDLYDKIVTIDHALTSLHDMAERIASNDDVIEIQMQGVHREPKKKPYNDNPETEIVTTGAIRASIFGGPVTPANEDTYETYGVFLKLSPTETLLVIEVLVRAKKTERRLLTTKLEQLVPVL